MKPVKFKEANGVLLKPVGVSDRECSSLPIHRDGQHCISCWELSEQELQKLRNTKRVWLWVWSGDTQPPVSLDVNNPFGPEPEPEPERPPVDAPEPPRRRRFG